jgi:hypothetical protein
MVNIELAGQARGGIAVVDAKLLARAVAVGVHRGFGHPQLAGDLLGRQMLVDQTQAFPLPGGEQADRIDGRGRARWHLK